MAAIFAHLEEPPPVASERDEALPPAVDAVLARAMAKEPEQRFDSWRELVGATHDAPRVLCLASGASGCDGRSQDADPEPQRAPVLI